MLSVAYSLGLGMPFIVLGLAYRRMLGAVRWVRRHQVWVTRVGGVMLVVVGLLLVTGWWDLWVAELRGWVGSASRCRCDGTASTRPPSRRPAGRRRAARATAGARPGELLRWAWRQLTSMRTALLLLLLLALASVPGLGRPAVRHRAPSR